MTDAFSYAVIGKAMEVHREPGPGVDEIFYHKLLSDRLRIAGIEHIYRPREELIHRGTIADIFEADLVFPGKLVAELKCLRSTFDPEHYVQLFCYLKFWRAPTGLLFDFAKDSLLHRRLNYEFKLMDNFAFRTILADGPEGDSTEELVAVCEGIGNVLANHGLGYRDTTYRGLLLADFRANGLNCQMRPPAAVSANGHSLGQTQCDCLVVGEHLGIRVLALRRAISGTDIAILRTHLRLLRLHTGLILNFGKTSLEHSWIRRPLAGPQAQEPEQLKSTFLS
jgi:GxxExxY protein